MNEIRHPVREAEEIARAREIVARHALPDFITDVDVKLAVVENEPALYVVYSEAPYDGGPDIEEVLRRADAYSEINRVILTELLDAFDDRLPFWSTVEAPQKV